MDGLFRIEYEVTFKFLPKDIRVVILSHDRALIELETIKAEPRYTLRSVTPVRRVTVNMVGCWVREDA